MHSSPALLAAGGPLVAGYADSLTLWELADKLADMAGCPVDLLDLRAASTVMQYQVITTGQRLWSTGLRAGLFECFVLSGKTALDMGQHIVRPALNTWWRFAILRSMTTKACSYPSWST